MISTILFITLVVFLIYAYIKKVRPKDFPPGPIPLPILGNLLHFGREPHKSFAKLTKKYGKILGLSIGGEKTVVIHDWKLLRQLWSDPIFANRPEGVDDGAVKFIAGGAEGIIHGTGEPWLEKRRFTLRHLRDFGFGKSTMEEYIMQEVKDMMDWFKKQNGKPVEVHRRFSLAVVNSLWYILTGERYQQDDKNLTKLLDELNACADQLLNFGSLKSLLLFFFFNIAKTFPNWSGWNKLEQLCKGKMDMFARVIKEHEETLPDGHPRDLVDVYLQESKITTDPNSSFHPLNAKSHLTNVMSDLFTAGSDTTSTALSWTMIYFINFPEVQKKLRAEIDRVVGKSRLPSLSDRKSMPYAEAVMMEILRFGAIGAIGVPHATSQNTTIDKYFIPKGTIVFANLYYVLNDPEAWGDPENFRPERFISQDGKNIVKPDAFIPFSFGKRACLGETLARDTIFLFMTSLTQNFEVLPDPSKPIPSLAQAGGGVAGAAPAPFSIIMKEIH